MGKPQSSSVPAPTAEVAPKTSIMAPPLGIDPVLIFPLGRGRVGKTVFANALAQYYRAFGADLKIWDMDLSTTSHSLAEFHADAETPPSSGLKDVGTWLEGNITKQALARRAGQHFDAIIGIGGGDMLIKKLAREVRLTQTLKKFKIRAVAVHVIGPNKADLDYLSQVSETNLFAPDAALIVLNSGLVTDGRSEAKAFDEVLQHSAIRDAVDKGAMIMPFPALPCMNEIMDRKIGFAAAANDEAPEGGTPLDMFDQVRTSVWWDEEIPAFFNRIPRAWMPFAPNLPAEQPAEDIVAAGLEVAE